MKGPPSYQIGLVQFGERRRSAKPVAFVPADAIARGKEIDLNEAADATREFERTRRFARRFSITLAPTRGAD